MNSKTKPVVMMIPGDLHLTEPHLANHKTAIRAVSEANDFIRPDFVQFIGDNVQDATDKQFRLFDDLTLQLACPWYALVGDHDIKGDPGAVGFRKWVGEPYGSLQLNGFRFIRLNTQEARPMGLDARQVKWFRAEVDDAVTAKEKIVLLQHNYPYQIWEDYAGPGIDEWRAIIQTRRIHGIFCGHTHYWQVANDGRNVHVATRSIGDPEGGPPGYTLVYLCGEDLALTYRTMDDRGPLVLVTSPRDALLCTGPEHVVSGNGILKASIWSRTPLATVEGWVGNNSRFSLDCVSPRDWLAPLTARLSKGVHRATVQAVDHDGEVGKSTIEFAVDPTGRYTAVPRVHPVVVATKFC